MQIIFYKNRKKRPKTLFSFQARYVLNQKRAEPINARSALLWGPQTILIFGESVEQDVALYKGCARSHASLSLSVLLLVLSGHDRPEVRFHGLLAARLVFLRVVRCTIGRYVRQGFGTRCNHSRDGGELLAAVQLVVTRFGASRDRTQSAQVQTAAVRGGRFRRTVSSQDHLLICVWPLST